jgi:hypothetical protein
MLLEIEIFQFCSLQAVRSPSGFARPARSPFAGRGFDFSVLLGIVRFQFLNFLVLF